MPVKKGITVLDWVVKSLQAITSKTYLFLVHRRRRSNSFEQIYHYAVGFQARKSSFYSLVLLCRTLPTGSRWSLR